MGSFLKIGSWLCDERGVSCQVIGIGTNSRSRKTMLKVRRLGQVRVIPLDAIAHWEPLPKPLERPIEVGDTVRLKGTQRAYEVRRLHQIYRGQDSYEQWAELVTPDNKPAHWKVQQLEIVEVVSDA